MHKTKKKQGIRNPRLEAKKCFRNSRIISANDEEAIAWLDKAIALNPNDATFWFERGDRLLHLERYQEATESYDKGIAIDPNNAEAWNYRGFALLCLAQFSAAVMSCDKAISIVPENAYIWFNRGTALSISKMYPEAVMSFNKALAIDPDFKDAQKCRGEIYDFLGDYR